MKNKFLMIIAVSLVVSLLTLLYFDMSGGNEYTQYITMQHVPSEIKGLNRDYPVEPYHITNNDLEYVSKIQKMIELTIDTANHYVNTSDRTPVNFLLKDDGDFYHITKPGPFMIWIEAYTNSNEFYSYQSYADKNFKSYHFSNSGKTVYYIQYENEVFEVTFNISDIDIQKDNCYPQTPNSDARLDLDSNNGTHSFDGRSCEWLKHNKLHS